MDPRHARLLAATLAYERGQASRIAHLVKVHGYAAAIGRLEDLDEETLFILEAAAILHDIGIPLSLEKYGSSAGHYQELEGPPVAEELLLQTGGYSPEQIQRIKYLVGHHHTYTDIQGADYQILIEADFLVNIDESPARYGPGAVKLEKIFKTEWGKVFLADIFATA